MLNKEITLRLSKWMTEDFVPPIRMVVLPTNRCNLRCLFCGGVYEREDSSFTYKDEMSSQKWIQIINDATKFGVKEWLIGGGGEPMVRANTVVEMIKTIKRLNPCSAIELSTNGTLITPSIAKNLVSAGCDFIQTGIDGSDAETHDLLRGRKGAFERTTNAIKLLASAKKMLGVNKPIIKVHVVLNAKNYNKLPQMISLIHSLGANFFAVAAMRVYGGGQEVAVNKAKLRMSEEQRKEVHQTWKKVEELASQYGIILGPAFYEGLEEVSKVIEYEIPTNFNDEQISCFLSAFCHAPFYSLIVDWAGNVGPCACAGSVKNTGNNLKTKSIREVWYGDFLKSVRNFMLNGKPIRLEEILPISGGLGVPMHPCESCGINVERKEIKDNLINYLKNCLNNK